MLQTSSQTSVTRPPWPFPHYTPSLHTSHKQTAWLVHAHIPMHAQLAESCHSDEKLGTGPTSLQTSLHSRYIPRYRPSPSPGQRPPFFTTICNFQAGAAEESFEFCTLLRLVTSRYIAVKYLVRDPTPACASRLACVGQLQFSSWSCGGVLRVLHLRWTVATFKREQRLFPLQTCVTRTPVTHLRNRIRGASRLTALKKLVARS